MCIIQNNLLHFMLDVQMLDLTYKYKKKSLSCFFPLVSFIRTINGVTFYLQHNVLLLLCVNSLFVSFTRLMVKNKG